MAGSWNPYSLQVTSWNYYYNWNYNFSFQIAPALLSPHAFVTVNNPSQIPVGYAVGYPIGYSRHNHVDDTYLLDPAQTNDQLLNNPGQPDQDRNRAQEEYEIGENGYDDDESLYEDDESEYSEDPPDFARQYENWLEMLTTQGDLEGNISRFRDAHRSEFYSTNFHDGHWSDFYSSDQGSGLSEDVITKYLKTRSVDITACEDNEILCVVCQDCLFRGEDKIVTLGCGHEYHEGCIRKWLMRKNSCPLCKATGIKVNLEENIHAQL